MSKSDEKSEDTQSLSDVATDCDSARQSPSQHGNSKGRWRQFHNFHYDYLCVFLIVIISRHITFGTLTSPHL